MGFAPIPRTAKASVGFSMLLLWDLKGIFLTPGVNPRFLEGKVISP